MKFGIRECANMVFKAKSDVTIGKYSFKAGQPVLYLDTARTSTLEQAASTVYAQGGRGYARLIAWEGEKTITFTVEDALISPISLAMLSGACSPKQVAGQMVNVHTTTQAVVNNDGSIDLTDALGASDTISADAPIYVILVEEDGSLTGTISESVAVNGKTISADTALAGKTVFIDYYIQKALANVTELHLTADQFAGYYYVEADTLFRRQNDGVDLPANLTFPNIKIQSNMTIALSSTGDPSTFTFTMDAFPAYTYFDKTHKVICAIQILEDAAANGENCTTVFPVGGEEAGD